MKWKKVEEELPIIPDGSHSIKLLVYYRNDNGPNFIGEMSYGEETRIATGKMIYEFRRHGRHPIKEPTHWMYMPEAPEEPNK